MFIILFFIFYKYIIFKIIIDIIILVYILLERGLGGVMRCVVCFSKLLGHRIGHTCVIKFIYLYYQCKQYLFYEQISNLSLTSLSLFPTPHIIFLKPFLNPCITCLFHFLLHLFYIMVYIYSVPGCFVLLLFFIVITSS